MASTTRPARSCSRASLRKTTGRRGPASPGAVYAAKGRTPTVMSRSVRQHVAREVVDRRVRGTRQHAHDRRQYLEDLEVVVCVHDLQVQRAQQTALRVAHRERSFALEPQSLGLELDLDITALWRDGTDAYVFLQ